MEKFLEEAKSGSRVLSAISGCDKNRILKEMAVALRNKTLELLEANALDMTDAHKNDL